MFETLKDIKKNKRAGDFLFPSLGGPIRGKVSYLSEEMVVVDSKIKGQVYQYITHPDNVCIVQKKS
ncbi:MAG: hypothetical protein ACYTBJ_08290 [Planctomycetota bacterium]|jgi:hypothetical protein